MDYLSQDEQEKIQAMRLSEPFVEESLQQVNRILASPQFRGLQEHAQDFLRFIVIKRLMGLADDIKETTVAVHVFGETTDYDPKEHTKVRVAAGSLRQRLRWYYKRDGLDDPIVITIPVGTYVPDIQDRRWHVAVSVFDNWNTRRDHEHLCHAVADEIAHRLTETRRGFARRVASLESSGDLPDYGLRGSVECSLEKLRINFSLSDLRSGVSILSDHVKGHRDDLLRLSQQVAGAVADELQRLRATSDGARPSPRPRRRRSSSRRARAHIQMALPPADSA
jgi:TolB-like protein